MTPLLIENINKKAPYKVVSSQNGIAFDFFTAYGVHYSVSFLYDDSSADRPHVADG